MREGRARPAYVDATGTRRRLQALAVLGWRWQDIAARRGVTWQSVQIVALGGRNVHRTTAAEVAAVIDGAERLALACHHHPDGDALGSMLAMHLLCEVNGKPSVASWPTPFVVAPHYEFLPGLDRCTPPDRFPAEPEVLVTFDLGHPGRLGDLAPAAARARELGQAS